MSTIYTPEMIAKFKALSDDFEQAIRRDERQRLLAKFRAEFPVTGNDTDMHGHPLHESRPQPKTFNPAEPFDYVELKLNETQRKMLSYLRDGFMAVPTLAGHLNIQKQSVYAYLDGIKRAGYDLEIRNTGNLRGGYRNIYRLAKAA